jgi:hypothetical protein
MALDGQAAGNNCRFTKVCFDCKRLSAKWGDKYTAMSYSHERTAQNAVGYVAAWLVNEVSRCAALCRSACDPQTPVVFVPSPAV